MFQFPKIICLNGKKATTKKDPWQVFAEKGDFSGEKRPKRDLKIGLCLLRDPK